MKYTEKQECIIVNCAYRLNSFVQYADSFSVSDILIQLQEIKENLTVLEKELSEESKND